MPATNSVPTRTILVSLPGPDFCLNVTEPDSIVSESVHPNVFKPFINAPVSGENDENTGVVLSTLNADNPVILLTGTILPAKSEELSVKAITPSMFSNPLVFNGIA